MNRADRRAAKAFKRHKKKPSWKIGPVPGIAAAWGAQRNAHGAKPRSIKGTADDPTRKRST